MEMHAWIHQVLTEAGGFDACPNAAMLGETISAEHTAAACVVRCLANPACAGSREVLEAIQRQRGLMDTEVMVAVKACDLIAWQALVAAIMDDDDRMGDDAQSRLEYLRDEIDDYYQGTARYLRTSV